MRAVNYVAVVGALLLVGNLHAADTKVGGFVNALYQWKDNGNGAGFGVGDGAVYINSDIGMCSATVDIPFNSTVGSGSLSVGATKAQAYVSHHYNMGVGWKLGQYDFPMGLEANDANNRVFVQKGIVGTNLLPVVQAGAWIDYAMGAHKLNLLIGNPVDSGFINSGTPAQFAAIANLALGGLSLDVGFLGQSAATFSWTVDAVAKYTMGKLSLGGEFVIKDTNAMGIGALVGFGMTDMMSLDGRFGILRKGSVDGGAADSAMDIAVGPTFAMSKALKCAIQYTMRNVTATAGGTATTSHMGTISANYSF